MTEDTSKQFRIELDKEQKVIRLGCRYYDLKGVLICEATEEEKSKYHCGKYMTYPVVDDDWEVREDEDIQYGISRLVVGKKGDVVLLDSLDRELDYNAQNRCCENITVLENLERHGIIVSNRKSLESEEELPDTIVLQIEKLSETRYRISTHSGSYYIAPRICCIGKDDELYGIRYPEGKETLDPWKLVDTIADDVFYLSEFFTKQNLRVFCVGLVESQNKDVYYDRVGVPTDWYYTIQTLDNDINRKVEELKKTYPIGRSSTKLPDPGLRK